MISKNMYRFVRFKHWNTYKLYILASIKTYKNVRCVLVNVTYYSHVYTWDQAG